MRLVAGKMLVSPGRVAYVLGSGMTSSFAMPRRRTTARALAAYGVGFAVLFALVTLVIWLLVSPRGERVGEVELGPTPSEIAVDAVAGDALFFRTSATSDTSPSASESHKDRERSVNGALGDSTLVLRLTAPNGTERESVCPIYNRRAMNTNLSDNTIEHTGMLNDCTFVIEMTGRHVVHATVRWSDKLAVTKSTIETRIERAKR